MIRATVRAVNRRMPVVAGTGFNAALGADIARRAERAEDNFILVLPPYYVLSPEAGLFAYYKGIADATSLPVMVYSRDWAVSTPEMMARLSDLVPTLVAWKDGQGDIRRLQRIMNYNGDRLAWFGGLAYTSSISNIAPQLSICAC